MLSVVTHLFTSPTIVFIVSSSCEHIQQFGQYRHNREYIFFMFKIHPRIVQNVNKNNVNICYSATISNCQETVKYFIQFTADKFP